MAFKYYSWNPESTSWSPESKTVLDYFLTWGEGWVSMIIYILRYTHEKLWRKFSYYMNLWALGFNNYFSMSILRGSVTSLAWEQAPPWGEKEKQIGERSEPRGSLRREKGGTALSPSPGHPSARFFRRYFSYLTPFFAFSPHCRAWSRANDSYAMTLEKIPLNDKITASCLQHIIIN